VTSSVSDATDKARLLSVTSPHSTHFRYPAAVCDLTTVPSTSLLAFDWEPTYVSLISALAERPLTQEDCMVCRAEGARHRNFNDLVWRAMAKADIPALKEPSGLLRTDGKRTDGVTLPPWKQRGTSQRAIHWLSHTGTRRPRHQARQHKRQPC